MNIVRLGFDGSSKLHVGQMPFESKEALLALKRELLGTHVVRRHRNAVEIVAVDSDSETTPGEVSVVEADSVPRLVSSLLSEWLIANFHKTGRTVYGGRRLGLVSRKPEDDLLSKAGLDQFDLPGWLALRINYIFEPRVMWTGKGTFVVLTIDSFSRFRIDAPVSQLMEHGAQVKGMYVRRLEPAWDTRLSPHGSLVGRVNGHDGGSLFLEDHAEGWPEIPADEAFLEPRAEMFRHTLEALTGRKAIDQEWSRIRQQIGRAAGGALRLKRLREMVGYLRGCKVELAPGFVGSFSKAVSTERRFPGYEVIQKPPLVFDPGLRKINRWNQGGLDRYGPYDQYQFTPKRLNIAVICEGDKQGRVEEFVERLLHGVPNTRGDDVGFLRRFALEKPYVRVFAAKSSSPDDYRAVLIQAIDHIADKGEQWHLALVQIEEGMEELDGDLNPYLVAKGFFLRHSIAVQQVRIETIQQPPRQLVYSLNNIGLACYAKLGGVPWLLPTEHKVAHELVIGLGSTVDRRSRIGAGRRVVGITTVFSGDGRYLLESRTRAVAFDDYRAAMLDAVRAAVARVRAEFAWKDDDPVRLVFHVFKPIRNTEADAVHELMEEIALPQAEYAFLHIAESHPYLVFDDMESGAKAAGGGTKGVSAAPRGLSIQLANREALLCLTGAKELKQASDGHPGPLLLNLHGKSTFRDLTYLSRQAFAFSCHSWRSFFPASVPITILYSQLVAKQLSLLSDVTDWSDDAIVGRIGRTRWFL